MDLTIRDSHEHCVFCTGVGQEPSNRGTIEKLFAFAPPTGVLSPPVAAIRKIKGGRYEAALGLRRYHGKKRTQDGWTWLCALAVSEDRAKVETALLPLRGLREIPDELARVRSLWRPQQPAAQS